MFDLTQFIKDKVVMRQESMFRPDITTHSTELTAAIDGKSVLVIGGAGSIGSNFVKAILPFKSATLVSSLDSAFKDPNLEKDRIVTLLEDYLGNFEHIETGKSLDSKM